jgi:hypothetical protein
MSKVKCETNFVCISNPSNQIEDQVTVKMERWQHQVDSGRLLIFKGGFHNEKDLEEAQRKCDLADSGKTVEGCPEHFSIYAKPFDLVKFAREILSFYTGYEKTLG